jgi:hypothetical protein
VHKPPLLPFTGIVMSQVTPDVIFMLFTHTSLIVIGVVPVLLNVALIDAPPVKSRFVSCPCSVAMKLNVRAPIHAATAMLTATVTAMSMIEATTGLRAFLLLNIFILFVIPPSGVIEYFSRSCAFKSYDSRHKITYVYDKNTQTPRKGGQPSVW